MLVASKVFVFYVSAVVLIYSSPLADAVEFKEGGDCGVVSSDLFKSDFAGNYLVSGPTGCELEGKKNCYCAPDLDDATRLSAWKWQCEGTVEFGPKEPKVCPAWTIDEVPKNGGAAVECDTSINPGGHKGDEVCAYSDCTEGGDTSIICACLDLDMYGLGEGVRWQCLHSTCSCGSYNVTSPDKSAAFSSACTKAFVLLSLVASIAIM